MEEVVVEVVAVMAWIEGRVQCGGRGTAMIVHTSAAAAEPERLTPSDWERSSMHLVWPLSFA